MYMTDGIKSVCTAIHVLKEWLFQVIHDVHVAISVPVMQCVEPLSTVVRTSGSRSKGLEFDFHCLSRAEVSHKLCIHSLFVHYIVHVIRYVFNLSGSLNCSLLC